MKPRISTTAGRLRLAMSAGIASIALVLTACGGDTSGKDGAGEVIVYDGGGAWGQAQREAYFEPFEKATGIKVKPAAADSPPAMRTGIESGKPGMDVTDIAGTVLSEWSKDGLLQPVDYAAWTKADPEDFKPYKTEKFAVPSLIFATQIAYDKKLTGGEIENWTDFFDTGAFKGKRSLGDGLTISSGVFEAALLADGVSPDALYPLDIDRAFKKLDEIKPRVLKFWTTGAESVQLLADQQVSATGAWNGRVDSLREQGAKVDSTWNQAILQTDYWAIPKGAANTKNAQKFVEFASRPDRQAAFAKLITYSPTNSKAFADLSAKRQKLMPTAPQYVDQTIASSNEFWSSDAGNGKPWSQEIVTRWQKWLSGK